MSQADFPPGPVASRTEIESAVIGIWRDVLNIDEIAPGDDFYALGGHSLTASRVTSRMQRALGVEVPLTEFFAHPTVAALTDFVVTERAGDAAS